ncbi:MAG TPA: hypothetical protein VJO13_17155 [Ktedonobacterales bacterium]|nr:hypothetical protein [Ktedonobacterales bacterium]
MQPSQQDQSQIAVQAPPVASRLGALLGWSLLVLFGACLVASVIAAVQAQRWSDAVDQAGAAFQDTLVTHPDRTQAAYAIYLAANAASRQATVVTYGLVIAGYLSAFVIPGLLYASTPSLLGGPLGTLMRQATHRLMTRQSRQWREITRYQGLGLMLAGAGWVILFLVSVVVQFMTVSLWLVSLSLIIAAWPVAIGAQFLSIFLMTEGWWWRYRRSILAESRPTPP